MNKHELRAYLEAQVEEIQKYKWIESERLRKDIGFQQAAFDWIQLHGEAFRRYWFKERHPELVAALPD